MAVTPFGSDVFDSIKGWVTEGSRANWPAGMAVDIQNMDINTAGEIRRRLGLIPEITGGDLTVPSMDGQAYSVHMWKDAGGVAGNEVLLIQHGMTLYAYGNSYPLENYFIGSVLLPKDVTARGDTAGQLVSITSVNGDAIVVHPCIVPQVLTLDGPELVLSPIQLSIRVQESISRAPTTSRPTSLTAEYEFDLRNAGWPYNTPCTKDEKGTGFVHADPVQYTYDKLGIWPALSDIFFACKTSVAEEAVALNTYSPWELQKQEMGSGYSVSGRFITTAWKLDTQALMQSAYVPFVMDPANQALLDAIAGLFPDFNPDTFGQNGGPITTRTITRHTSERPSAVAVLNGRIVYAGRDYNGSYCLFFSQMAVDKHTYGKCYQEADPTIEEINDLVATDGGVIRTPAMGKVFKMVELNGSLVLFSTTGVWSLSGSGDAVAFDALSFQVTKISPEECISPRSVVLLDSSVVFFSRTGIYVIGMGEQGTLEASSMTRTTIQQWYDDLPTDVRVGAVGVADSTLGRIEWTMTTHDESVYFTHILVFDARRAGFLKHRVPYDNARIIMPLPPYGTTASGAGAVVTNPVVTTTGEAVVTTTSDPVIISSNELTLSLANARRFRYLSSNQTSGNCFVAEMQSTTFKDWFGVPSTVPVDAHAFVDCPYIYNTVTDGRVANPKRSARASAQYISAFTLRGRLL